MRRYHVLVTVAMLFCGGCGKATVETGDGTTGSGGALPGSTVSSAGSSGDPECVRTFDPNTGAESLSDCPPPSDSACATSYCGDDGACHVHNFPIGALCSATDSCDGAGHCKTIQLDCGDCDDGNECTADDCQANKGQCIHEILSGAHLCKGGAGHCNQDTAECCDEVIVVEIPDPMFPDLKAYKCAPACPAGQAADPNNGICKG